MIIQLNVGISELKYYYISCKIMHCTVDPQPGSFHWLLSCLSNSRLCPRPTLLRLVQKIGFTHVSASFALSFFIAYLLVHTASVPRRNSKCLDVSFSCSVQ